MEVNECGTRRCLKQNMRKNNSLNRFRPNIGRGGVSADIDEKIAYIGLIFHPNESLSQPPQLFSGVYLCFLENSSFVTHKFDSST